MIYHIISECSKLAKKEYKTKHDLMDKAIHWELCKKFKFDHTNKWYMHNKTSTLENDTQTPTGFWYTNGSPNLGQKTRPYRNRQKKRTCRIEDFAVPADDRVKLKESEKKDKYVDFELKKPWNRKVTSTPIVIGSLDTVPEGLL